MDRQITIQQNTPVRDATGEPVDAWTDLATVWADFLPAGGREFWGARQVNAASIANFRIHYRSDVVRKMRVVFDGDNYDIADVAEDRRFGFKEFLLIRAEARVS